jgi:hypothetical protein
MCFMRLISAHSSTPSKRLSSGLDHQIEPDQGSNRTPPTPRLRWTTFRPTQADQYSGGAYSAPAQSPAPVPAGAAARAPRAAELARRVGKVVSRTAACRRSKKRGQSHPYPNGHRHLTQLLRSRTLWERVPGRREPQAVLLVRSSGTISGHAHGAIRRSGRDTRVRTK